MQTAYFEMIRRRRTIRRFTDRPVARPALFGLLEAARLAPSAANRQPLVFIGVDEPGRVDELFGAMKFAGALPAEQKPVFGERPRAYALIGRVKELDSADAVRDVGAAVMSILMGAVAHGLGACWLRSFSRPQVGQILDLPPTVEADSMVALGWPAEAARAEPLAGGRTAYWRDETGGHHVPKRAVGEVVFLNGYGRAWA